jgi:hypothetical protein
VIARHHACRRHRAASVGLLLLIALLCRCTPPSVAPSPRPCVPACHRAGRCSDLDGQLLAARQPLLRCVGERARRGELTDAHRCYRALRLLESARWWLKTLLGQDELLTVYQVTESHRLEFLCRIAELARATTPGAVERLYLEMIRAFP